MLRSVDHIEFIVRNLDATIQFYRTLGFEVTRETPHHERSVEMEAGPDLPVLEMHQPEMQEVLGINHYGWTVTDVRASFEKLRSTGLLVQREPVVARSTGRLLANFRDPDGMRFQIVNEAQRQGATRGPARALHHIELYSRAAGAYSDFFQSLGLRRVGPDDEPWELEVPSTPRTVVFIRQARGAALVGLHHIAFLVDDVDAVTDSMRAAGAAVDPACENPRLGESRRMCVRDPDGWPVELVARG